MSELEIILTELEKKLKDNACEFMLIVTDKINGKTASLFSDDQVHLACSYMLMLQTDEKFRKFVMSSLAIYLNTDMKSKQEMQDAMRKLAAGNMPSLN